MSERLQRLQEMQASYNQTIRAEGEAAVRELLQEFFAANPTIAAVKWAQYTPYFNDGDPCIFRVGDPQIKLVREFVPADSANDSSNETQSSDNADDEVADSNYDIDEDVDDDGFTYIWSASQVGATLYNAVSDLGEKLSGIEDILEVIFGEALVVATPTELTVEEHVEHD